MQTNQLQTKHPRTQFKYIPPTYTLGYFIIVIGTMVISGIGILQGKYSAWQTDGEKIIDDKQWYRVVTGIFSVYSFLDVIFMLSSCAWLLFTLTQFENRYSTLYTIFHFLKVNIMIALSVTGLYYIMFTLTGMKNFIMNMGGIYPYTLHIYLKTCLQKPSQIVNHWFLPCPINRWVMGYLVSLLSMLLSPQSQGCLIIHLCYLFFSFLVWIQYLTGILCLYRDQPLFPIIFFIIQKFIPNCIKNHYGFCSISVYYKKAEQARQESKKQSELNEEIQQQTQNTGN